MAEVMLNGRVYDDDGELAERQMGFRDDEFEEYMDWLKEATWALYRNSNSASARQGREKLIDRVLEEYEESVDAQIRDMINREKDNIHYELHGDNGDTQYELPDDEEPDYGLGEDDELFYNQFAYGVEEDDPWDLLYA